MFMIRASRNYRADWPRIAAITLDCYYWCFEANNENASIACEAYLASCFVTLVER
jgi:hypothetical protein